MRPLNLFLALFVSLLSGCSGSGPAGLTLMPNGDLVVESGTAMKGPFIAGSTVTLNTLTKKSTSTSTSATAIRPALSPSGKAYTFETNGQGKFDTSGVIFSADDNFLEAHVEGYYFDEISGMRSDDFITLRGVVDSTSQSLNINVLTDLSRQRILTLVRSTVANRCNVAKSNSTVAADVALCTVSSADFLAARQQAEKEVLLAFKIPVSALAGNSFADLNFKNIANLTILQSPRAGDQILLALSALVMQIGKDGAGVTEFINAFETDLSDDGLINDASLDLATQISRASSTVSFSRVAANMNSFYKTSKYAATDFQQWVDPTGGVVGVIGRLTEYFNINTTATTTKYTSNTFSFTGSSAFGTCLRMTAANSTSTVNFSGTVPAMSNGFYLVPTGTAVTLSVSSTPTVVSGLPSLNAQTKLEVWDAVAANTCTTLSQVGLQGIYYYAATSPGLNLFANKFISDFAKCFNLTVTNRVKAVDLQNPDIPEVTQVDDVCTPLWGSPWGPYLSNGYRPGQQYYWMLNDTSMVKTAKITQMDVVDNYVGRDGRLVARMLFKYMDRYNRLSSFGILAVKDNQYANTETQGWYNYGNQQPVDTDIKAGVRRVIFIPLADGTNVKSFKDVKNLFRTALLPLINNVGPGTKLSDGRTLSAVRITGPGLPDAGLVYIPPLQSGQIYFDFSNSEGVLPTNAVTPNRLKRCGIQPASNSNLSVLPASCPLNYIGETLATSADLATGQTTIPSTATMGSLAFTSLPVYNTNQPTGGIWLPSNTGDLMKMGMEYTFSLYYGNSSTPTYVYGKRLNNSVPTLAEIKAMQWIGLKTVGTVDFAAITNAAVNPFETLRPAAGATTLDLSWTGSVLNSLEVNQLNTAIQMNFYNRATPGDSVARGLSAGTLAPQLNQDGVPREIRWSGNMDQNTGVPVTTPVGPTLPLYRVLGFEFRTWDGSWKSQDYVFDTWAH